MRRSTLFTAAALLMIGSTAFAQSKPNFAGHWVILPDSSASASQQGMPRGGAAMGGLSEEALITQDDKQLTVSRTLTFGPLKSVYNLDGTDQQQSLDVGNGNMIDLTLKAKWAGDTLKTSTWANVQGQSIEIVLNMWLDAQGNLVTEHITPDMGQGGGTAITKYKKTP